MNHEVPSKEALNALPEVKEFPIPRTPEKFLKLTWKDSRGRYWQRVFINDVPHKIRLLK